MTKMMNNVWNVYKEKIVEGNFVKRVRKMAVILVLTVVMSMGSGCGFSFENAAGLPQVTITEESETLNAGGAEGQAMLPKITVEERRWKENREEDLKKQELKEETEVKQDSGEKGPEGDNSEGQEPQDGYSGDYSSAGNDNSTKTGTENTGIPMQDPGTQGNETPENPETPEQPQESENPEPPQEPVHEHEYTMEIERVEATCEKDGFVVRQCECSETEKELLAAKGHQEAWETVKTASCTESGLEALKCKECKNVAEVRSAPASGHVESSWITDREATCTENGSRHKSCQICGETIATETLEAKGHSFGEFEVTVEPGCTAEGEKTRSCSSCGEKGSVSLDAKGHSYGDWIVDTEATEEQAGERHKECADCGDIVTEEVEQLPKHEHDFAESGRIESTCAETGRLTYTCSGCQESYEETIPVKAHAAGEWKMEKAPTEAEAGLRVKRCANCGAEIETEILEKVPHSHDYTVKRTEAGCERAGEIVYTCSCGDIYREEIPAVGHRYGITENVEASCGKEGYVTRTCENCGDVQTETKEALEHILGEWEIITEAALGKDGEKVRKCTNCEKTIETEKIDMLLTDGVDSVYFVDLEDGSQEMIIGHFDEKLAEKAIELIDAYRVENGYQALETCTSEVEAFTEVRAVEIVVKFSHERPNGKNAVLDYDIIWGENIAKGYLTAEAVFEGWKNSPGHNANMLKNEYGTYRAGCLKCFSRKLSNGSYYNYWSHSFMW